MLHQEESDEHISEVKEFAIPRLGIVHLWDGSTTNGNWILLDMTAPVGNPNAVYNPEPSDDTNDHKPYTPNREEIEKERARWAKRHHLRAENERNEKFREYVLELAEQSEGITRERWLEIAKNPGDWQIVPPNKTDISLADRPWHDEHMKMLEEKWRREEETKKHCDYLFQMAQYANKYTRGTLVYGRANYIGHIWDILNKFNINLLPFISARMQLDKMAPVILPNMGNPAHNDARTFMKWIAGNAQKFGMGCCNEFAAVAAEFINQFDMPCMVAGTQGFGHAFVVLGTTNPHVEDWDDECVIICDPYYNKVFVATKTSFQREYPNYGLRINRIAIYP